MKKVICWALGALSLITSSLAVAGELSCYESNHYRDREVVATLSYEDGATTGTLTAYGDTYEPVTLAFSPTGRLTHAYLSEQADLRIQSFVPGPQGLIYARLTIYGVSPTDSARQVALLCDGS